MPRPLRVHVEGAAQYITARAIAPHLLFRDARDYQTYLDLLEEYRVKFGFTLYAYVLFPDHLHLCLEPSPAATVSAIMHALSSRYTKYFNRRHRHAGHLFQERFKSTLVEQAPSLLRLTAYLHLYPLRMGAVEDLAEYRWTSYANYLAVPSAVPGTPQRLGTGGEPGTEIREVAAVLKRLAGAYPGLTYEQYVLSMTEPEWQQFHEELRQRVVGSPSFVALVEQRLKAPSKPAAEERTMAPQPRPRLMVRPRESRIPAHILNGTFALAFISLCAAALYAKNLETMKQTVQALLQERLAVSGFVSEPDGPAARLASFGGPAALRDVQVQVEVRAVLGTAQAQADALEFHRGRLTSRFLKAQGFSPSRYSMVAQPDGTVRWEAMQTSAFGETAHWRGEWDGQTIRGVMTRQKSGATPVDFSFVGAAMTSDDSRREI